MDMLRHWIRQTLLESLGRNGARDLVRMIMGLPKLNMLETSSDATGRVVSWFRSDVDGHLYEVVVSPVGRALFQIPDHLRSKQNMNEPLGSQDVEELIRASLGDNLNGLTLTRDSEKYYDFTLHYNDLIISKQNFEELIKSKLLQFPLRFSLLSPGPLGTLRLRYHKV